MMKNRTWLVGALVLGLVLFTSSIASARSQRNLAYGSDITWTTAVRLLRVDMGFQLTERDSDARFVLFQYSEGEHHFPGSLEIVERQLEDGRLGVRIIVSVPAMPSYVELNLIDRLERKLAEEVGPPLPVPARVSRSQRTAPQSPEESPPAEGDESDGESDE
jgi:hypothetical protein